VGERRRSGMSEHEEPRKEEEIQDLDLDESEEGQEVTERVTGGRRPIS
jgi:hypothetical protein